MKTATFNGYKTVDKHCHVIANICVQMKGDESEEEVDM